MGTIEIGKHTCDLPPEGNPGDEWRCPDCSQTWWADDIPVEGMVFIAWRRAS